MDGPSKSRGIASLIPAGWQLQPPDPTWQGRRFIAPDGESWLAIYSRPADTAAPAEHLKNVAFAEGEQIAYLEGRRNWLVVSGFKSNRIYFRKVVLACDGRIWRHLALEYSASAIRALDPLVIEFSNASTPDVEGDDCASDNSSQ